MDHVYRFCDTDSENYYLDGLGFVTLKDGRFGFKDGTHRIEPADMKIEYAREKGIPLAVVRVGGKELMDAFNAAHDFAFFEYGYDPRTHERLNKRSPDYQKQLDSAYSRFEPLARKL